MTSRGIRRAAIYLDDADRRIWLEVLAKVCERHNCVIHSFCQMTNHYHLLIETVDANLPTCMRQLNSIYSQRFNRRHSLVGHVFQGRYHAILVQRERYLLEVSRYIVLNPLRASVVQALSEWPWSSYRYFVSDETQPNWLERDALLDHFGDTPASAIAAYKEFVLAGIGQPDPLDATHRHVVLGDEPFVSEHQQLQRSVGLIETKKSERRAVALPLSDYQARFPDRVEAMARAYASTAFTMSQIASAFEVTTKTVSRAVAAFEKASKEKLA